jgi:hypothetical protein
LVPQTDLLSMMLHESLTIPPSLKYRLMHRSPTNGFSLSIHLLGVNALQGLVPA